MSGLWRVFVYGMSDLKPNKARRTLVGDNQKSAALGFVCTVGYENGQAN